MDLIWGFYLGWDWSPVIFLIVLVLSLALAWIMKSWPILWVLPAIVLYNGLHWEMPGPLMFLFKLVFWIVVIIAVLTAVLPGRSRLAKVPFKQMVGLLAVLLVVALLTGGWNLVTGDSENQPSKPSRPSATTTVTVTPPPVVKTVGPTPQQIAKAVVSAMRHKHIRDKEWTAHVDWREHIVERRSAFVNQTLKTQKDVNDFLAGSSQGSQMARQQAEKALNGRPITDCYYVAVQFKLPVQYRGNTYKNGARIITPNGLRQAKMGDVIWLCVLDGKTVNWGASLRADCGNVNFTQIVVVREHTKPAPPVTCVRHCKPPSGSGGCVSNCGGLTPKSSNPGDYTVEQGTPLGSAEGTASEPSRVQTSSGSDSPTKKPGSETGTQAPGSNPAPSTPPPAPESGANDASGGGASCVPPPGMTTC